MYRKVKQKGVASAGPEMFAETGLLDLRWISSAYEFRFQNSSLLIQYPLGFTETTLWLQLDVVKRKDNVDMTDYMESGK